MRLFLLLLLLITAACHSGDLPAASTAATAYRLGPGDKLHIQTFGEDQLTGDYTIDGEGRIAFPLVGTVKAAGRTADEFHADLVAALTQQALRNPRVTVEIIAYRPVYILGEVTRPGEFPYSSDLSVFALVAKAGGFTYRANQKRVFIRHAGETGEVAYKLDAATPVRPGDTVRIVDRIL